VAEPKGIAIVGTGLLGGSIGLGLRAAGYRGRRLGVGRRQQTLEKAAARGCIDSGTCHLSDAAREADLMVLATPLGQFDEVLARLADCQHAGLVVTDVGSVKGSVCAKALELLPHGNLFVGSHPMAGSERQGPDHAQADLFRGRPCILVPGRADEAAVAMVRWLWRTLGMRLLEMTAPEHDLRVAAISHLPHAAAAVLLCNAAEAGAFDVASSGLADTTRVASGDPELWADIFLHNPTAVSRQLESYGQNLQRLRQLIDRRDRPGLANFLRASKQSRDDWLARTTLPPESGE